MIYFFNNIFYIFIIQLLSLYLNNNYRIRLNQSYLISLILIATNQYILFELNLLFYSELLLIPIIIFLIYNLTKNIKKIKINYKNLIFYNLIFILFLFLYKNKYYLDQDEFSYWGKLLKFTFLADKIGFDMKNLQYYQFPFLNNYNYLTGNFIGFKEDVHLFFNNLFIIFSIIFLIKEKTISYNFFLKFIIIFLILNCLSFGLISIYADPIIAIIGSCIFYTIYQNKINPEPNDFIKIFLLIIPLVLSHKFGLVILVGVIFLIIINYYKNLSLKNFLLIILFSYFIHLFYSGNITYRIVNLDLNIALIDKFFIKELYYFSKEILFFPITYSIFFESFNKIISLFGLENFSLNVIKTTIFFWLILFLFLTYFLQFEDKFKILIFFLIFSISSFLIIFIIKIYLNKLSLYAFSRYYSITLASLFIFLISITDFNKNSNLRLILILFLFLFMAPKKTFSLFVNDKIYYSQKENLNFYKNRLIIKNFSNKYNNFNYEKIKNNEINISRINENYHPSDGLRLSSKLNANLINQNSIKIIVGDKISNYNTIPELFFYMEILNFELNPLNNLKFITIQDENLELFDFDKENIFIFNPKLKYNKYPSIKLYEH